MLLISVKVLIGIINVLFVIGLEKVEPAEPQSSVVDVEATTKKPVGFFNYTSLVPHLLPFPGKVFSVIYSSTFIF